MPRFAMVGGSTGELLTYGGRVLVHGDRHEYEWLFPKARIVRVTDGDLGQPVMRLQDHPSLEHVRFPLRKEDFLYG